MSIPPGIREPTGPAGGTDGRLEHLRGIVHGFTDQVDYRLRRFLRSRGFTTHLHP